MLNLYLLRHGQTEASRDRRFSGTIDVQLSPIGHRMAEAFAEAYGAVPWTAIYTSPLQRARDTAATLARRIGMPARIDESWRELKYGMWEGVLEDDVRARWRDDYTRWAADPASLAAPGGETGVAAGARACAALDRIRRAHESGEVLVVSHKSTLRLAICALLGIDLRHYRERVACPVASITLFEVSAGGALLKRLGDVSHLPPELRDLPGS